MNEGGTIISIASAPQASEAVQNEADKHNVNFSAYGVQSNGEDMNNLKKMLENGTLKPHLSKTFPFAEMAEAHREVESGRTVGKVVVKL